MRKLIYLAILLCSASTLTFAQINEGGEPLSLKNSQLEKKVPTITLEALSEEEINTIDQRDDGRIPISGLVRPLDISTANSGKWTTLNNGDKIWRIAITAKEAKSTSLYFENFKVPEGAKLFIYQADYSQIIGAFTSANNYESGQFATELIYGETSVVEYYQPAAVQSNAPFSIAQVLHNFKAAPWQNSVNGFNDSDPCQVNINCSEGNNWQDEKKGVARIQVIGTNQFGQTVGGWCTGSLVNNTNLDCNPYFLTAYHCADNSSAANFNNFVFYFGFEANGCNTPGSQPNSNTITGASVIATSNSINNSDMLLLELNTNVPQNYDVYYNGWNSVNTPATSGVGIHHPAGDIKKISTFNNSPTTTGWNGGGVTHWNVQWNATANGHGVTEGGSSGSPIFDQNGLIVGTLTGGGSFCTAVNSPDQYGKMSYHWNSNGTANNRRVDIWLDPVGNGSATSLAGTYAPCSPSFATDAGISLINEPSADICGSTFTPEITLRNYGTNTLTSCAIRYRINNGALQTFNWTGSLATNATTLITLTPMTAVNGTNTFEAFTQNPNNTTDQNASNDSRSYTFDAEAAQSLPLQEGFDANTFPPANFTINNPDGGDTWERNNTIGGYGTSTGAAFLDLWNYDNSEGELDWLITEAYDFSTVNNPELSFDYAYSYYDGPAGLLYDTLGIAYTTNCGQNWLGWLFYEGGADLSTTATGGQQPEFTPTANEWATETIDLSVFTGEPSVQFAFIVISGWGNNIALDNINISSQAVSNPPVADFSASSIAVCVGASVSFTNLSTNNPTSNTWSFTGGTPSTSTLTNPVVTYNTPGVYEVSLTATNADGSDTETKTAYITVSALPSLSITNTTVSCNNGNDGTATVNVTNGGGPFTYNWTNSSANTATASGLPDGSYTVTVTNNGGCSASISTTISEPNPLNLNVTNTDDVCSQGQGSAVANTTGGTPPYTYSWSSGSGNNLSAGTYTVTVTDNNNCSASQNFTIGNNSPTYNVVVNTTPASCGSNNGSASATVNGSTNGFTFNFSSGNSAGPNSVNGLGFGTYTLTITDANNCVQTETFNITNANAPSVSVSTSNVTCNGGTNGAATATVTGGTAPYTFSWGNSSSTSNLAAGTYTLIVEDAAGCQTQALYQINEPTAISLSETIVNEHCDQADGSIQVAVSGGNAPYTFIWNGNVGNNTLNNLVQGTYNLVITDANNCSFNASYTITNEAPPSIQVLSVQNACSGQSNGSIDVEVSGGTGILSYDWGNSFTEDLQNAAAGTYTLTVTDAFGCSDAVTETIGEFVSDLETNLTVVNNTNSTDVLSSVSGGDMPYSYSWSSGETSPSLNQVSSGVYILTVTDANGCQTIDTAFVGTVSIQESNWISYINLYPNPTNSSISLDYSFEQKPNATVAVFNTLGQQIITNKTIENKQGKLIIDLRNYAAGVYFVKISNQEDAKLMRIIKE